ncbi:MAG: CHAT domain-containing protein [Isosphaeraceae bacterium]
MATPSPNAELQIGLHRLDANRYSVELQSRPPDSDADMTPVRGTTTFDLEVLRTAEWEGPDTVGKLLTERLFADPAILTHYQQACIAAETAVAVLRVRLFIGPTAPELHALKWELLRDPRTGTILATRERVVFSRYPSSHDWRPVRLRPQEALRALVVIANPTDLGKYKMAPVDVDGERKRARDALGEIPIVEVTGPETFPHLIDRLREEFDILYLVGHGALIDGEPTLWLESSTGASDKRPGRDLVDRLSELPRPPRLVVLASCQSAGTGSGAEVKVGEAGVLAALGPRLAEAGIPAVVAMQGDVFMDTIQRFMPVFFRELRRDGQIDRAVAAARAQVRDHSDSWVPALFLRLTSGRIWYVPGFARVPGQEFDLWPGLLTYLKPKKPKCMPILGSGLLEPYLGPTREFARRWAERNHFPLADYAREDLPQVAQYLSVSFKASALRAMFEEELSDALQRHLSLEGTSPTATDSASALLSQAGTLRRQKDPAEPHRVLAALPFPIYLTTNPDHLLVEALCEAGKQPEIGLCPWSEKVDWSESIFAPDHDPDFRPSVDRPLVYYLFGRFDDPRSLVLTEDDYFDYLIGLTRNNELVPAVVRRALVDTALLFIGFRLDDWDFRVLFRSLMAQGGRQRSADYAHVAVQIDPEVGHNLDPEGSRRFLQRYFEDADIRIYWGQVGDFAREILDRWSRVQHPPTGGRT